MKREKEVVSSIELQAKNSENMKKKKKPEPGYLGGIGNLTNKQTKKPKKKTYSSNATLNFSQYGCFLIDASTRYGQGTITNSNKSYQKRPYWYTHFLLYQTT